MSGSGFHERVQERIDQLARGDRSTALALAALVLTAGEDGSATFNDVAIRYRDDHLAALRERQEQLLLDPTVQATLDLSYLALPPEARRVLRLLAVQPARDLRRLFPAAPEYSLLLLKATNQMPHGGGHRLESNSYEERLLTRWIEQGMPYGSEEDPVVERIEVFPKQRDMNPKGKQQLAVIAHYSDGTKQDVTHVASYEANEPLMAGATSTGRVTAFDLPGQVAMAALDQPISSMTAVYGTRSSRRIVAAVCLLPLWGLWLAAGPPMEEGFMLVFPEMVIEGLVPNKDFLHLYGPGSIWVIAGLFKLFGISIWTARVFGFVQLVECGFQHTSLKDIEVGSAPGRDLGPEFPNICMHLLVECPRTSLAIPFLKARWSWYPFTFLVALNCLVAGIWTHGREPSTPSVSCDVDPGCESALQSRMLSMSHLVAERLP
jgi:hypothetical protein